MSTKTVKRAPKTTTATPATNEPVAKVVKPRLVKKAAPVTPLVTEPAMALTAVVASEQTAEPVVTTSTAATTTTAVTTDATTTTNDKNERHQASRLIGCYISSARVRRHLNMTLNKPIEDELRKLSLELERLEAAKKAVVAGGVTDNSGEKEVFNPFSEQQLAEYKAIVAAIEPFVTEYKLKKDALSRDRVRFSNEAPIVLNIICDELVKQLFTYAMDRTLAHGMSNVEIKHMFLDPVNVGLPAGPSFDSLSLYPLVKTLPTFVKYETELRNSSNNDRLAALQEEVRNNTWKEFRAAFVGMLPKRKKGTPSFPQKPPKAADGVPIAADEPTDNGNDDGKTGFTFYVVHACRSLIKNNPDKYSHIRIKDNVKTFLNSILVEFIQRMSRLIQVTTEAMTRKTVNDVAILKTVEKLLVDGHVPKETIKYVPARVPDPNAYDAELAKRKEEKAEGRTYTFDVSKLPTVDGYAATKVVVYESAGFNELKHCVEQKLAKYRELKASAAAEDTMSV